jgi:hypothetical protein
MATETAQNSLKSILSNFRDKDKKKIVRYLKKSIRDIKKNIRKNK